ncbi:MAG: hypothetical protein ACPLXL_00355 [Minisyncoccia bacterium]
MTERNRRLAKKWFFDYNSRSPLKGGIKMFRTRNNLEGKKRTDLVKKVLVFLKKIVDITLVHIYFRIAGKTPFLIAIDDETFLQDILRCVFSECEIDEIQDCLLESKDNILEKIKLKIKEEIKRWPKIILVLKRLEREYNIALESLNEEDFLVFFLKKLEKKHNVSLDEEEFKKILRRSKKIIKRCLVKEKFSYCL